MADIVIRPSLKFIKAGYVCALLVVCAAVIVHYKYLAAQYPRPYLPIASVIVLLWPIKRHLQRQSVKLTLSGEKLRYETGLTSKSTRIIQLPKVQDVRFIQSIWQRVFNVGDISIETAGENSRLVVENLDQPRELAEQITDASGHPASGGLH
ncbi:MAG: PH domain-containing protein [Acidobacteriaceae bacterium]|nr:PH domain-containing protein [Acidobacteriaceae bacterium]